MGASVISIDCLCFVEKFSIFLHIFTLWLYLYRNHYVIFKYRHMCMKDCLKILPSSMNNTDHIPKLSTTLDIKRCAKSMDLMSKVILDITKMCDVTHKIH